MEKFSWSVNEYSPKERTPDWFWGLGLIALLGAGASVYFHDYLFAALIILSALTISMLSKRTPSLINYEVSADGITIDQLLYPFNTLQSFWIEQRFKRPKIIVVSKKFFMPHIVIPIEGHEPSSLRSFLLQYLTETEHHEPLAHIIAERLGL